MAKKPKTNYSGSDKDTFILSDATQQNILTLIKSYTSEGRSRLKDRRDRFQIVDKKLQLEFEREKRGSKHDYQYDHRPPIMLSHLDTAYAFFTDLFANGDPIFQIVGAPEQKDIITQMQLKVDQDVEEYRYQNNIAKAMRDALKYDECTLELDWESRLLPTFGPSDTDGRATVNKNMYEGNKLKYISPYNTFYDETVEHGRRHVDGTHAGYFEMVSLPVLHREITSMISVGKSVMNFNDVYTAGVTERNYMMPEIGGKQSQSSPDSNGMRSLFNFGETTNSVDKKYEQYKEMYERTTVYVRFIPFMYGINCPDSTRVQIFKFVVVNNTLILAERITNIQQYFPMLTAQLNDENIGVSKSMAELLMPTQNLAEELADLKLASLYKANGDKLIYDARIISKADIESRKPDAKIPARPSALGRGLQEAVYPLRSDATAFNLISAIEGTLGQDAANITGQNNASRGQFQKGNKTLREYQDVMTNAEAVKYVKAILLESTFFMPLKSMIRNNILQYTTGGEVNVRGNTATIDPVALRKAALGFRVADGLKNVERLAKTGALQEAINMLLPQAEVALAQGVDVFAVLFQYLFLQGFNVENYRVAPQNLRAQANQQPPATPPDAVTAG